MFLLYKKYLKYYKKEVVLGPLFKLIEVIFELIVPFIIAKMIDEGINNQNLKLIYILSGVLFLIAIIGISSTLVCQYLASKASQGVGTKIRSDLFKHIESLSIKEYDKISTSSLISRLNTDINQVEVSVAMLIRLVIRAPFLVIGASVMAIFINYKIAIMFIIFSLLVLVVVLLIMKKNIQLNKNVSLDLDDLTTITKENLVGSKVIRGFNNKKYEEDRFNNKTIALYNNSNKLAKISNLLNPSSQIIINVCLLITIFISKNLISTNFILQGDVVALINYLNQILVAIVVVCNLVQTFSKSSNSARRINEVFALESSIKSGELTSTLNTEEVLRFENVNFAYNDDNYVLKDINFAIYDKEIVAIVGMTASGKTTLFNLINRFYDVSSGNIYFYHKNIKDYDLKFLNKSIGYALNKAKLLRGSVYDNLKFISDDENQIIDALKKADCDFVLKSPEKLNKEIIERGNNLSGGEKQRLSLARLFLKDAKINLIDDSLSALDLKTEKKVLENIKNMHKTTLIITERINTIKNCDKIIVLNNNTIEAFGDEKYCLEHSQMFRELYELQEVTYEN